MRRTCVAAATALLGSTGCGSGEPEYTNAPRPPAPLTVTGAINEGRVRVSPADFGAGPITIIVSNQSGAARELTFETDEVGGAQGGIRRTVGPIADHSTAELQANPREGTYRLGVGDKAIEPATITVGKPRPSAQDQLLQP
jgi:hypothetical protein